VTWSSEPSGSVYRCVAPTVLIAGLSPHLAFDERYRDFLTLAAGQIAASLATAQRFEAQQRRLTALEELDRAKTHFFNDISHEFRTPLTLMLGPTEDALASPARALSGESLEAVHRNTLRLLRLVNMLLDFAQLEADRLAPRFAEHDLARLTTEHASAFQSAFERAGVTLAIDCQTVPGRAPATREPYRGATPARRGDRLRTSVGSRAVRGSWLRRALCQAGRSRRVRAAARQAVAAIVGRPSTWLNRAASRRLGWPLTASIRP
jgi:signal transduction histidine kinase